MGSHDYETEEAQEVVGHLERFSVNVERDLKHLFYGLKEDNVVLTALKRYQEAFTFAEYSSCRSKGNPPAIKKKEDIYVLVNNCVGASKVSEKDRKSLDKMVEDAIEKVKPIDKSLHKTIENCQKHPSKFCEEDKKRDLENLESFLSPLEPGNVHEFGANIVSKGLEELTACFEKHTEGIAKRFDDATYDIEACMGLFDLPQE